MKRAAIDKETTYFDFSKIKNKSSILVTGTSTEVGKTFACIKLIELFKEQFQNEKIFAVKPIETGCKENQKGKLEGPDINALSKALLLKESEVFSLYYKLFRSPVAPLVAEAAEGDKIDWEDLKSFINSSMNQSKADLFLIEGAGGLLVPITGKKTYLQLTKELGAEVLLVVPNKLGCLNHALLTLEVLKEEGVKVAGYIFNEFKEAGPEKNLPGTVSAKETNREVLRSLASDYGVEEVGYLSVSN